MDKTMLIHLLIGPLILVLAILFRTFPPKSINYIYGYRTSYSMKSQEVWEEANRYSSKLMIVVGVIVTLAQLILYFAIAGHLSLTIPIILLVVLLIAIIPVTEGHLRRNFDKDGRPVKGD